MATILNKNLIRESTVQHEGREIMVTLTADQKIQLKLKGMKSGSVSIDIIELYNQLTGNDANNKLNKNKGPVTVSNTTEPKKKLGRVVNVNEFVNDLRSLNAISGADISIVTHFDNLIKEWKENNPK